MTLSPPVVYAEINALVGLTWLVAGPMLARVARHCPQVPQRELLRVSRWLLLAALAAPAAVTVLPRHQLFRAPEELWRRSRQAAVGASLRRPAGSAASRPAALPEAPDPASALTAIWLLLGAAAALRLAATARGALRLRGLVSRSYPWRRVGRLDIRLSDEVAVPLSFTAFARAFVVIPRQLAADPGAFQIALRHEGQHHRHGDTAWLALAEALRLLLPLNVALLFWAKAIGTLQEFACDEAVVVRAGSPGVHAYGRCLLKVSEAALRRPMPSAAASMAPAGSDPLHSKHMLERRLAMLSRYLPPPSRQPRGVWPVATLAAALVAVFGFAYAANGAKNRDPLTLAETRRLVAAMDLSPDFPLTVNEPVVARLNRDITDPGRAQDYKDALQRMQKLKPMLTSYLQKYEMPQNLLAVPLVESRYENLSKAEWAKRIVGTTNIGAGLWMFIPATARNFGLQVNDKVDERLSPPNATDAAMRLIASGKERFKDMWLALAAYNQGTVAVQEAIDKGATREPWQLYQKGLLNEYIVYVSAAVILINNPQLLE